MLVDDNYQELLSTTRSESKNNLQSIVVIQDDDIDPRPVILYTREEDIPDDRTCEEKTKDCIEAIKRSSKQCWHCIKRFWRKITNNEDLIANELEKFEEDYREI